MREVAYKAKGKQYFAIGFKNDRGGYELRNGLGFKSGKTENGISTIEMNTDSATVFEGFFDFLAAMQYYGREIPLHTTIILNSCNNVYQAIPLLANRKAVHCFLDNDESSRRTL